MKLLQLSYTASTITEFLEIMVTFCVNFTQLYLQRMSLGINSGLKVYGSCIT